MRRVEVENQARFLTFSCYHRLPLFQNDKIKDLFALRLQQVHEEQRFRLTAWVIMPEHIHLLLVPNLPQYPVSALVHELKGPFGEAVLERWQELNAPVLERLRDKAGRLHFWLPGGGYDRNIFTAEEWREKFNYIHWNPVVRGLVKEPQDWPWSSARWYAGDRSGPVIVDPSER
jgi:putative transposase